MKKVLTSLQMQNIDKYCIEHLNIPSSLLMENAGYELFKSIYEKTGLNLRTKILFICGKGNNGGDGFVAARHAVIKKLNINILSIAKPENMSKDTLLNHNVLRNFTDILYLDDLNLKYTEELINNHDIIIDAIFGTGLSNTIKEPYSQIIEFINRSNNYVVSADIPSGICSNSGKILGNAVKSNKTVTFAAHKLGMFMYPAVEYCGNIVVGEISIPHNVLNHEKHNINLITEDFIKNNIPKRIENSHKNSYGKCLVIAGSRLMPGAAFLSAKPVMKTGCGYCTLVTSQDRLSNSFGFMPECVFFDAELERQNIDRIVEEIKKNTSIVIGPGITDSENTVEFISSFIKKINDIIIPVIFDADALNCISKLENVRLPEMSVLTPHPKELSRLLKVELSEINDNRVKYARALSEKYNCITVLKGANTIISDKTGNIYINPTGNSALATAGTGDVLSGILGGFTAQNKDILNMVIVSVYLHGKAGEIASKKSNEYSVTAMDVIYNIENAINIVLGRSYFP